MNTETQGVSTQTMDNRSQNTNAFQRITTSAETSNASCVGRQTMPMPTKTWKTHPAYFFLLDLLTKKGAMTDADLFEALVDECKDLGFKDFNELLMKLEISGKIRLTSMSRGKRRIELIA